jgi:hypothetical protein
MNSDRNFPNSGVLFANNKRGDNPKAPNAKGDGTLTIPAGYITEHWDGTSDLVVPLDLAAWTREGRAGRFQSLTIKLKGAWRQRPTETTEPARPDGQDEESEIPF